MFIKQISIFIENKSGRLAQIAGILADNAINIHALSIADTTDFGILRLIVSDAEKAVRALKENGVTVKMTDVVAVSMEHRPGGLADVLKKLEKAEIAIEYMYAFVSRSGGGALVILKLVNQEEAVRVMAESGIGLIGSEVIKNL